MINGEEDIIAAKHHDQERSEVLKNPVLLYFFHHYSSFVRKDQAIFQHEYRVKPFEFNVNNPFQFVFGFLKQLVFILLHAKQATIMVVQFGGYISFLPSLLGKLFRIPVLIIVGGTDCVSFPSIRYGNFSSGVLAWFTKTSYRMCSHIASVSESLAFCKDTYNNTDSLYQGFMYFCKDLKTPYSVIGNGYSGDFWEPVRESRIPSSFVTLTSGFGSRHFYQLKGFDLIMEAARNLPDFTFTIVGVPEHYRFQNQAPNVHCLPFCNAIELRDIYSRHEFFMQISMSEGFPNAITEAMLCGCIPIGSSVGSLPNIIGDSGFILEKRDPGLLTELIQKANSSDKTRLASIARKRIQTYFPLQKRERELLQLIRNLHKT
jgi:glycosyltransferase involved in cell wall biosynthesis